MTLKDKFHEYIELTYECDIPEENLDEMYEMFMAGAFLTYERIVKQQRVEEVAQDITQYLEYLEHKSPTNTTDQPIKQ